MRRVEKAFLVSSIRQYFNEPVKRLICGIMVVLMVAASVLPAKRVQAYTYETPGTPETSAEIESVKYPTTTDMDFDASTVDIVAEAEDLRTENTKTFLKEDGTFVTAIYAEPVHYLVNDKYEDIDNTFSLDVDSGSYSTKANAFGVQFPSSLGLDNQIRLRYGNYSIAWTLAGNSKSSSIQIADVKSSDNPKVLTKTHQSVVYSSVMDGLDVEYTVTGSSVKENIVLNKYVEDFSLSFLYTLGNLSLVLQEDGTYSFTDERGDSIFDFSPLYMFDADGNESQNVKMTVTEREKGKYQITIVPDPEWLKTAVYPVMIDPTVRSVLQSIPFYDTYVSSGSPSSNYSTQTSMVVSGIYSTNLYQGLISFDLPSSVMNKQITYSYLSMTRGAYTSGKEIVLKMNAANFNASTVIWYSKPGYSTSITDYNIIGSSSVYKFDITDAVKQWQASGIQSVPGFTIMEKNSYGSSLSILTTESSGTVNDPVVEIGYIDPEGIKDYWTYSSQDGSDSGTGYVSDYTGLLTWIREDINFSTELQTLSLSMVYNIANRATDIGYGRGWQTNYNMKVVYDTYLNKYYCVDSTGNKVYYQYSSQIVDPNLDSLYEMIQYGMEAEFFISEDGSNQMMMVLYDELDDLCGIYIVTTGYTVFSFYGDNNVFYLWTITENFPSDYPKDLTILRQIANPEKITRVTDDVGNYLLMAYDAAGKLASVSLYLKHPSPESDTMNQRVIYQFTQPSTGVYVLSSRWMEKDFDGNSTFTTDDVVTYGYDSAQRLLSASDASSGKIEYTYNSTTNKVNTVETSRVDGTTEYIFSTVTYSYSTKKTTITDQDGNYIIRKFDDYGHTVNILDSNGTAQSFAYLNLFKNHNDTTGFYTLIDGTPNYKINHKLITESLPQISQMNPSANPDFEYGLSFGYNEWELVLETGSDAQGYTIDGFQEEEEEFEEPLPRVGYGAIRIYSTNDNGAYLIQDILLDAGTYTLSGYVRNETDSSEGVFIEALGASYGSTPMEVSILSEWQFVYQYFVVEEDNTTVNIKLSDYGEGFAYFDAIQVNKGFSTSRINLIENSSFEKMNGTSPWVEWNPSDSTNVTRTAMTYDSSINGEINGTYGVKIVGSPTIKRYCSDFISSFLNFMPGEGSMLVGAWAKSEGTPTSKLTSDSYDRLFRIRVSTYNFSNNQNILVSTSYIDFDSSIEGWQYNFGTVAIESQVTHVMICLEYQGEGTVYFDNAQAFFEPAFTDYSYDNNGRITSVVKPGGETVSYEYPSGNTFLRIPSTLTTETVTGEITTESGQIDSVEANDLLYSFTKNVYGQITSVVVQEGTNTYFATSTGYLSTAFNQYVSSKTDEFGNATNYYNDVYTGLLEAIENAKGQDTHCLYDDEGKLIEVRSEDDFDSANPVLAGKVAYAYDSQDRLIRICLQYTDSNSPTYYYQITYDEQGRMESVLVNQTSLMTYVYEDESGSYSDRVSSQTYGNLDVISFVYDDSGRVTQVNYQLYGETTPTTRYAYEYDSMGNVNVITTWNPTQPNADPTREFFAYDASGRVIMIMDTEGNTIEYGYDENGNVAELSFLIDGSSTSTFFTYNDVGSIESTLVNSVSTNEIVKNRTYETLALKRLASISLVLGISNPTILYNRTFSYSGYTNRITQVVYDINSLTGIDYKFTYVYDELGNITEEAYYENDVLQTKHNYEYDVMNQLVVEDIWLNSGNDYSYTYTYDSRGNRTEFSRFGYQRNGLDSADYTLSYTYSQTWLDQMTSNDIMVNGTPITQNYVYDTQGNPTSITNFYYFNGTSAQYYHHAVLTWDGRQLAKIEIFNASQELPANLVSTLVYTYNDQGYRLSKTITDAGQSPVVTAYDLLESQVIHESNGTDEIFFSYDVDRSLISFNLNGEDYFCITNQLGDIVALVDEDRVEISSYEYDAYGNFLFSTGSIKSPVTYRGYRFDREIGLFYLNSRYYNSQTGRFLNGDGLLGQTGDILSTNMYAYCVNNPITNVDPTGFWVMSLFGFTITYGAFGGGFVSVWWVFDGKGNQGILITAGVGLYLPGVSLSYSPFFSWRKTIFDLQGISYVAGGGFSGIASFGCDVLVDNKGVLGFQLNLGIGAGMPIDIHGAYCVTALIPLKGLYSLIWIKQNLNKIISEIRGALS